MGIWTHSLKFNVGTGGVQQLPQTTGDGIHSLLQEVVWDVGDSVPNPVLQLFHCSRFYPVHLLHFGIVCRPVMAITSTDETADMENSPYSILRSQSSGVSSCT